MGERFRPYTTYTRKISGVDYKVKVPAVDIGDGQEPAASIQMMLLAELLIAERLLETAPLANETLRWVRKSCGLTHEQFIHSINCRVNEYIYAVDTHDGRALDTDKYRDAIKRLIAKKRSECNCDEEEAVELVT